MSRRVSSSSWLDTVAGLLDGRRANRQPGFTRKLTGERLERRMVLSTAPVDEAAAEGLSLAEYLEQDPGMGPIIPAEYSGGDAATVDAATVEGSAPVEISPTVEPTAADQIFDYYESSAYAEGAGEGEGESSGSGSGSGEPSVDVTTETDENGETVVSGTISDDGGVEELSISISSGSGTLSVDADGNFTIVDGVPNDQGYITLTVTDADGNTSEITIYF